MLFFLLLLLISPKSNASPLHEDPKWRRLLHYRSTVFEGIVSEADGLGFFLHQTGKTDPKAELQKSIEVFGSTKYPDDSHPICKFPLRYRWLNEKLGKPWTADLTGCQTYQSFYTKVAAKRATAVFSSYYMTNPSSAFGHTLLRLGRFEDERETEMLDYGVNFAADAREKNPFLYAFKGLMGGYLGKFAAVPYYYKVREYSDHEFRDIWSYELRLTQSEVSEIVDHLWELGHTHFDYFYFDENCSYHILGLLEVVRPSLELKKNFRLFSIPADTIRLLYREGLIEEGKKRPSTLTRLRRRSEGVSQKDLVLARVIAEKPLEAAKLLADVSPEKAATVLDVSMEAFDFYHSEALLKDDPETLQKKHHILASRATNPIITPELAEQISTQNESPAKGHPPTRLSFSGKYYDDQGLSSRLEIRPALHDLLDPPAGSVRNAQLEMGKLSLEYRQKDFGGQHLILDNLSIVNIGNYPSQNFWTSPLAWELSAGARQLRWSDCFDCPGGFLDFSIGNSLEVFENRLLMVILLSSDLDLQSQFSHNYRHGLGPKGLGRVIISDDWILGGSSAYRFITYEHQNPFARTEWWNEVELRHHLNKRYSLALKFQAIEREREWLTSGEFGLQYFYE